MLARREVQGDQVVDNSLLFFMIVSFNPIAMRWSSLALALLTGVALGADDTTTTTTDPSTSSSTSSSLALSDASTVSNPSSVAMPSGSYLVYSTTVTLSNGDSSVLVSSTITGNSSATSTGNQTVVTTTSDSLTVLIGGAGTTTLGNSSMNATATTTGTATATPVVNTRPCNNYAEFCQRKYSNITMVAAHNSPFVRKGNAAANQDLTVTNQLNDGIRMRTYLEIPVSSPCMVFPANVVLGHL